ncbi:hypothetical protein [Streptomyces diastaticus]|nr:hypothetical protein [Streptomyces diastaticus]
MPYVLTAVAALVLLAPAQHGAAPPVMFFAVLQEGRWPLGPA